MPESVLKEIVSPLAHELAEYVLLQKDLMAAHAAFTLWFAKYAGRAQKLTAGERLISLSLFRDSVVMFVGCFDKTAPLSLSAEDVFKSRDGALDYFEWIRAIRDSYAAHKFGPFRQCVTGVQVDERGIVLGAGHTERIYAGFVPAGERDLLELIGIAGLHAERKVMELSRKLTEIGKAMSRAELAALNPAKTYDVEPHEVRMSREKFRRGH